MIPMKRIRFFILPLLILWSTARLLAQTETNRFPLSVDRISQALLTSGLLTQAGDIELPMPLFTSVPSPQLAVVGSEAAADARLRLRISCVSHEECVPFFILVNLHDKQRALDAQAVLRAKFRAVSPTKLPSSPAVLAGEQAVLLLGDDHIEIRLPVVTIDTGKVGAEVRVASLDRKRTYRGLVIETGIVRGELP